MGIVIKDKMPQGITRLSISFIEKTMAKMGLSDPYEVEVVNGVALDSDVVTIFRFSKDGVYYELQTDGFSVGYYGEGPTGLRNMLRKFKMVGPQPGEVRLRDGESFKWVSSGSLGAEGDLV